MEDSDRFPRQVSLACHDLRTPLATIYGFARTLTRAEGYDERTMRFLGMIEAAAEQMTALLDDLGTSARVEGGRFEPFPREVNTLELAASDDERIVVTGEGVVAELDGEAISRALHGFAIAALRHGQIELVTWNVDGRSFALAPVTEAAAPIVVGEEIRDLGALVARQVVEALGGTLAVEGETLTVSV